MIKINRPDAGNYTALENMRKTLSAKADSVFSYRGINPYSVAFDKFKREGNENLSQDLWQQASNRGELDQYINLLAQNPRKSAKLTQLLDTYGARVDYDTTMLALAYDAAKDDTPEERFDDNGNSIGKLSQRELIDKVLQNQAMQWEAQIEQDAKHSANFWKKIANTGKAIFTEEGAFLLDAGAGLSRGINAAGNFIASGVYTLKEVATGRANTFEEIAQAYAFSADAQYANDKQLNVGGTRANPVAEVDKIEAALSKTAYDIRRKYSYSVDPTTGEYKYWGKILSGMADSMGYMAIALASGNPAGMYLPMFVDNVRENIKLNGYNADYSKMMTNAMLKTGVEYAIEWGLGKIIGFSKLDTLLGFGDDAAKITTQTVIKGATASSKQAAKQVGLNLLKDMIKEGSEEVLQDTSGLIIDYLYGDKYAKRSDENGSLANLAQSFVIGAATSLVIGSVSTLTVDRAIGIDENGVAYRMNAFQSVAYKDSVRTMQNWQAIANDKNADVNSRIEAALKLEVASATLGSLYESVGIENTAKAEQLLADIQKHHDKKTSINDQVAKGTYVKDIMSGMFADGSNEVGGNAWIQAMNIVNTNANIVQTDMGASQFTKVGQVHKSFSRSINDIKVQAKLQASGVSKVDTPVDVTTEVYDDDSIFSMAKNLGFSVVVPTDGRDVILSEDVLFMPENFMTTDTTTLMKNIVTLKTIDNIVANIPSDLLKSVIDTYRSLVPVDGKYAEGEIEQQAIAALMFDKNFQLKLLLQSRGNNNAWGTEVGIKFIQNLKKMVAKTYTTTKVDGKQKRTLSEITQSIADKVVKSLQDTFVVFNTTVASSVAYNTKTDKVEVKPELAKILTTEQQEQITNNQAVKNGALLELLRTTDYNKLQPKVKEQVINFIRDGVNSLSDELPLLEQFSKLLELNEPSTNKIIEALVKRLELGYNAIIDAMAALTYFAHNSYYNDYIHDKKLFMIPVDSSNLSQFMESYKVITEIETTLLGKQSIKTVLSEQFDEALVDTTILNRADDFVDNPRVRYLVLNSIIKQRTNGKLAILQNGDLIHPSADINNLSKGVQDALQNNTLSAFLAETQFNKPDKILRLQDFFSIKLNKKIGNMPVIITQTRANYEAQGSAQGLMGYYTTLGYIHLQLPSDVFASTATMSVLFHEMIHAVMNSTVSDIRYNTVGGGTDDITKALNELAPEIVEDLRVYLKDNFSIIYKLFNTNNASNKNIGKMLYFLLYDEIEARSIGQLDLLALSGFSYRLESDLHTGFVIGPDKNGIYLISPDGKKKWYYTTRYEIQSSTLTHAKVRISYLLNKKDTSIYQQRLNELLDTETINEFWDKLIDVHSTTKFIASNTLMEIENVFIDTYLDTKDANEHVVQIGSNSIYEDVTRAFPQVDKIQLKLLLGSMKQKLDAALEDFKVDNEYDDISLFNITEYSEITLKLANDFIASLGANAIKHPQLSTDVINLIGNQIFAKIITPLESYLELDHHIKTLVTLPQSLRYEIPKTFNFGEYSFTKHTGRTYMLTKQNPNNGRYITQEVDMETLMPVRADQQSLIPDQETRNKMAFVIKRKIEVAKNAKPEEKTPEVPKPPKPKEQGKLVWDFGPYTVREYDRTHYIIFKDAKRSQTDDTDFAKSEIVNKATLLPDHVSEFGSGKSLLSASERKNLLNWISRDAKPFTVEKEMPDGTKKTKLIPNLEFSVKLGELDDNGRTMIINTIKQSFMSTPDGKYFDALIGDLLKSTMHNRKFYDFVFKDMATIEMIYILARYNNTGLSLRNGITKYVDDYLATEQGKEVAKAIPETKQLLTKQLTTNAKAFNELLSKNPELAKLLKTTLIDFVPDYEMSRDVDKDAIVAFKEAAETDPLYDNIPDNMNIDYNQPVFMKAVAEFYKKYPNLREWVEGKTDRTQDQAIEASKAKMESLRLLYEELAVQTYNMNMSFEKFLTTPIYFVRTMDTDQVKSYGLNSVSLGYDLTRLPVFGGKDSKFVYTGTLLPQELTVYLPFSYAEGLVRSEVFAKNKPISFAEYEQYVDRTSKPVTSAFEMPTSAFEMPTSTRTYISAKRAAKSNLKYFVKKGHILQLHRAVVDFVEATTENFDKLSKYFQVRIKNGKLTYNDIKHYVATTKSMNEDTWHALAKHVYKNDALANISYSVAKFLIDKDRLENFALIARMTEDAEVLDQKNSIVTFKQIDNDFKKKLKEEFGKANKPLSEKYDKLSKQLNTWWAYNEEGKLERNEFIIDEKQLLPIFMNHYDGTLRSLNTIYTLAKTLAGKQILQSLRENTSDNADDANANKTTKISSGNAATENNASAAKRGGSKIYKWLDNRKQNTIDYEDITELAEDTKTVEDLTDEDKFNMIYNHLYELELSDITKPTTQDEYEADKDVLEAISELDDVDIDNLINYILAEARGAVPLIENEVIDRDLGAIKIAKDGLRNRTRRLIQKLAGSKVIYNNLPTEIKDLIEFSTTGSKINTAAYTNLSEDALIALSDKVAAEIKRLNKAQQEAKALEKNKEAIAKRIAKLNERNAKLAEREAKLKAREKAVKEGATLRSKINVTYDTKIEKQSFTITGPSEINPKLLAILNHTWNKQTRSKVKYMADSVQTIQNVHIASEFYTEHAAELAAMTLSEIEDVTDWLIHAYINDTGTAKQTFEATQFFILAYIYNETNRMFVGMNANLKQQLGAFLKSVQTSAGTLLSLVKQVKEKLNPSVVIASALFREFNLQLTDEQQTRLDKALNSGDSVQLSEVVHEIKAELLATTTPKQVSALRKVAAIRSMSMVSGPMTWVRNITSNYALSGLNRIATKISNAFFPALTAKTENTTIQYKMNAKVTTEIQDFITTQFIESGFFDETLDQLSKYNPSQVLRHKAADHNDLLSDMILHAVYNEFYSSSMFNNKLLNQIHSFLMDRLSDKNFVRAAAIRYLGKMLAETNHHLNADGSIKQGVDTDVMKDIANAFALATSDYMHSDNFFSHIEQWLTQHSQTAWAAYKLIMPFATASWNWFKAAMRYSPVGLGQSIVRLTKLENEIILREQAWQKGEAQISPELATYLVKRDFGAGIIGTLAFGFGAILAALGYISLEDDDWGTPKIQIGNLRIDVSSIFGSSSALAGAAFIKTLQTKDLTTSLDAMLEPLVDGFFFTDLLQMDANSPKGWFEWTKYQAQSIALSFIPSMVRYISGMTYTGTYKPNNTFQKAVVRLPFLGQAFNVPKRTNVYTGDSDGTFWDIVHRAIPYIEVVTKSQLQKDTEAYGLNKEELNGTYLINGVSFKTSPKQTAKINKLYGELNADDLTDFYANQTAYKVLTANNTYAKKTYSQMTPTEISNALDQIFSKNSTIAKVSAWLDAGHMYYTNDPDLFATLRKLGYEKVYKGTKGFVN